LHHLQNPGKRIANNGSVLRRVDSFYRSYQRILVRCFLAVPGRGGLAAEVLKREEK